MSLFQLVFLRFNSNILLMGGRGRQRGRQRRGVDGSIVVLTFYFHQSALRFVFV